MTQGDRNPDADQHGGLALLAANVRDAVTGTDETSEDAELRQSVATLVDDVSNGLQVVLGYAQILHELDDEERGSAIAAISETCERLQAALGELTSYSRDADGHAPWQAPRGDD